MKKETKTRILDAAEKLIVELGAEKASLRKITAEAGVNIAAINYHFGSKDNLVSAILERFLNPVLHELMTGLETLVKQSGEKGPEIEDIIRCNLVPIYQFSIKNPDYENIFYQLSRSYDDQNVFRQSIQKTMEKNMKFYAQHIVRALPDIPEETTLMRFAFFRNTSTGIMKGDFIMEESIDVLGLPRNYENMLNEMVTYTAAAFRAKPGTRSVAEEKYKK